MFQGISQSKRGLKAVLENKQILKLFHDCRNDWDSLLYQHSVRIYNFIDTQEAFYIFNLFHFGEIALPISLMNFIQKILGLKLSQKDNFKNEMKKDYAMFGRRPLTNQMLTYASEDVKHLITAWKVIEINFNSNLREIVSFSSILKVIDYYLFNQFQDFIVSSVLQINRKNIYSFYDTSIFYTDYVYEFFQTCVTDIDSLYNNEKLKDNYEQINKIQSIIKLGMSYKKKQHSRKEQNFEIKPFNSLNSEIFNNYTESNWYCTNGEFYTSTISKCKKKFKNKNRNKKFYFNFKK